MKTHKVLLAFCLIFAIGSTTSCTSLARRKPLEIAPYNQQLTLNDIHEISVVFEEVIPSRPLNETVWDNATGAFWDVEESKQIGFTQDYSKFLPVAASAGLLGGAVGGAVVGGIAGPELVNTRIVIPFGNIFSKTFESAVDRNIEKHSACYQPGCPSQIFTPNSLKIKIGGFYVWEGPLNHLNLVVKGKSTYFRNGTVIKEYTFEKSLLLQKLGTMMSTHASFMREMNRISNVLAQDVSTDVMSNAFK